MRTHLPNHLFTDNSFDDKFEEDIPLVQGENIEHSNELDNINFLD